MTNDEWWGKIVEDAASEAYVFDAQTFQFLLVNRGARDNLGYTMEELRSLTPWDLKPRFTHDQFIVMVQPLLNGDERLLEFETVHQRKDGSTYDVAVRLQVMETTDSRVFYAAIEDVTEKKSAERALGETTRRLHAILQNTKMAVFMMDEHQHCIYMNAAAEQLTGYSFEETQGRPLHDVIHHTYPDGRPFPLHECAIDRAFPEDNQMSGEEVFVHKDGSFYPVGFTASPMRDESGKTIGTVVEVRNIEEELKARNTMRMFNKTLQRRVDEEVNERQQIEAQLFQAQKMEAIGKLTGGVAHDFNNLLQVVRGNLDLLTKDVAGNERAERRVQNAIAGVSRGSKLAAQLLAFGRRQPLEPAPINLGRLVRDMDDMLRRSLGEGVEIETVVDAGLWNCMADPTQVENVILNIAINARDAMAGRGKLTMEAGNAALGDDYVAHHPGLAAGQYVMLAFTDTGCGMSPEVLEQAFEPFFSTKPEGQGSGLGLSMVYGFARQSGGHARLYSEVGQGTTVRIYLPRTRLAETQSTALRDEALVGGEETILVVEDDKEVRATAVEMLSDLGYKVLKANDADSAIAIVESGVRIDLLFTDVVMPGKMRSPELARRTRAQLPGAGVLFTSGYTQNAIVHAGRLDEGVELLSKPYSRDQLARKVRHVLDNRSNVDAGGPVQSSGEDAFRSKSVRVLLVEDEALIRISTLDMLEDLGCRASEAASVAEANACLAEAGYDVLLTDITLPDGSGLELALNAVRSAPDLRVIVASGRDVSSEEAAAGFTRLNKPYDQDKLRRALEHSLAAPRHRDP